MVVGAVVAVVAVGVAVEMMIDVDFDAGDFDEPNCWRQRSLVVLIDELVVVVTTTAAAAVAAPMATGRD